ncbi:twin-arginine translocase subunit TatC, partial [Patescibacteria group bacterium]|nr:twin-arginine translocase subunit TatC [Patescibacteria group bacterium]
MSENKENFQKDKEMGIIDHLTEFRKRLIVCFAAVGIFTASAYLFSNQLLSFLTYPAQWISLTSLKPTEVFMAKMKIAVIFGVLASSPIIFYQIWSFVSPALKKAE